MKPEKKPRFPRKHLVLSIISLILVAVFSLGSVFANSYAKLINQALGLSSTKIIRPEGAEEEGCDRNQQADGIESEGDVLQYGATLKRFNYVFCLYHVRIS